jgi:hypothetical protein
VLPTPIPGLPDTFDHRESCEFFEFRSLLFPVFVPAGFDNAHLTGVTFAYLWDRCGVISRVAQNVSKLPIVLLYVEHTRRVEVP